MNSITNTTTAWFDTNQSAFGMPCGHTSVSMTTGDLSDATGLMNGRVVGIDGAALKPAVFGLYSAAQVEGLNAWSPPSC